MVSLTELAIRALRKLRPRGNAEHLALGREGERHAYFYLKELGYRIVATNFRVPQNRGEIDIIGWDDGVLCFIEVKTRTNDSFAPPSTAVNRPKQEHIKAVARAYLRRLPGVPAGGCRFDVVSVVPSPAGRQPAITLRKGAFSWTTARRRRTRDFLRSRFRHDASARWRSQ